MGFGVSLSPHSAQFAVCWLPRGPLHLHHGSPYPAHPRPALLWPGAPGHGLLPGDHSRYKGGGSLPLSPWCVPHSPCSTLAAELASRLATDVPLASRVVPDSANIALRNLGKVLGLSAFMLALSPRLTLLALLEVPLAIVARKVYNARYQVMVDMGQ